jgi:hypothetical protein
MRTNFDIIKTGNDCDVKFFDTTEYEMQDFTGYDVAFRALFSEFVRINVYNPDNTITTFGNTESPDIVIDTTDSYWSFQDISLKNCGMYIFEFINVPRVNQAFYNKGDCMTYNGLFYTCLADGAFLEVVAGVPTFYDSLGVRNTNFKEITLDQIDKRYYRIKYYKCEIDECLISSLESFFCSIEDSFINKNIIETEEYRKSSELFILFKTAYECLSKNLGFIDFINKENLQDALNIKLLINFLCCCCKCK